jgi:hypothetical protein
MNTLLAHDTDVQISYVYKREFALLPIEVDSGDFCFLEWYYTKYVIYDTTWVYDVQPLGRFTKEEVIMGRLRN